MKTTKHREKGQDPSRKLNRASTEGQVLAATISISLSQQNNNNLTSCGYINGRKTYIHT